MSHTPDPNPGSDWPATLRVVVGLIVVWGCLFLVALAQEQSRKESQQGKPAASAAPAVTHR